ncbi:MAG: hypothetical protein ACLTD2_00760 [Ruminococcus sp.]
MKKIEPFKQKVWLASPTMHGEELEYVTEAYNTNWMSTVGKNINEVEKIAAEKSEVRVCCWPFMLARSRFTCAVSLLARGFMASLLYLVALLRGRRVFAVT